MINIILLITMIVLFVLVVIGSLYFLVYFQHEEDKNTAWFPKIVVILGLSLSCFNVLLLPMDVINRNTQGGLNIFIALEIFLMATAGFVLVIIPFSIFYYENVDDGRHPIRRAIIWTFITFFIFALIIILLYLFVGKAEIEVTLLQGGTIPETDPVQTTPCTLNCSRKYGFWDVKVSVVVYIIAILSFAGWLLFMLFGGIGIIAIPLDLILGWVHRPRRIKLEQYARYKTDINRRASDLLLDARKIDESRRIGKGSKMKQRRKYNEFRKAVFFLEEDYKNLNLAYKEFGGSPVKHFLKLLLGIVSLVVSIIWILHIILYMLPKKPISLFMNNYLNSLDDAFSLFGAITYGIFSFYLLWAVVKGNVKFGFRIFFFSVHPMRINGTIMSSLLFNTALILLSSITVSQFCAMAFADYARLTSFDMLYGVQVTNLQGFRVVWKVFTDILMGIIGLTLIILIIKPRDRSKNKILRFHK